MPMINELISKLNESPPQSEGELRELLGETGYDLIMTDPSMDGESPDQMASDEAPREDMAEEEMAEDEMAEDMGPKEDMDMAEDAMSPMKIMEELMPPGMGKPHANENPRTKVRRLTLQAAYNATPEAKRETKV